MVNTKNRSTPVVEKKDETCGCGCSECTCGSDCKCGCNCGCSCGFGKTALQCGTILISALMVAGAILVKPCLRPGMHPFPFAGERARPAPVNEAPDLNEAIAAFIDENPGVIIASLQKYDGEQAGEEPAKANAFDLNRLEKVDAGLVQQVINDKTNYSLGNPKGKFVIIEFFDYQCGWCKKTNAELEEAVASAAGKNIRWIPIDTPIFGEASETIARYVLAAGEQGKYAQMHKAVADAQELNDASRAVSVAVNEYIETNKLDPRNNMDDRAKVEAFNSEMVKKEYPPALAKIGKKLGLNEDKLHRAANGDKIRQKLISNNVFREKLEINGVPMVIIDGHKNPGALFGDNLAAVVELSKNKK